MTPAIEIFANREELASALAARVAALASETVAARRRFLFAIPGGSAVSLLARGWVDADVDASNWELFWTDERCVPQTDPQSNFRLAQTGLLPRLRSANIHPADGSLGPDAAARAYEKVLGGFPRLDLVLLGLGGDGHVASLFLGNPALLETRRWVAPVRNAPKPPPDRITLTLTVLNRARHILVVATGAGKADALSRVFSAPSHLPAQLLIPADGDLRWLVDRAAAAKPKENP